jgi:hypothetical protein
METNDNQRKIPQTLPVDNHRRLVTNPLYPNKFMPFTSIGFHFESWRDFSADELQIANELENAESRFEKRLQKEIDRRADAVAKTNTTINGAAIAV